MKKHLSIFSTLCSALLLSSCGAQSSEETKETTPKFNPNAISVNTIAPDRGLADPHIMMVGDTIYAMCGHDKSWNTVDFCRMDRWELWATTDLEHWEYKLSIHPTQTYIGDEDNCWAGDLATKDGKYYWYFSNRSFNTGVMVAPTICGPWVDALGEPLLTPDMAKTKPYDPEIYEENGKYSIIFGAGQYYMATLGDDMISLATKPQKVMVYDEAGERVGTGDKPCIFKRGDYYYLMWGFEYAMSKQLEGPYTYKGAFLDGGHGTVFEYKNQWYSMQENHETNAFYRGVQIRPLYFNADSTAYIPQKNFEYPLPERIYNFEHSTQGWRSELGTEVKRDSAACYIYGETDSLGAIVASTPFLHTPLYLCNSVKVVLRNPSGATLMRVALNGYNDDTQFTRRAPQKVDWSAEEWIECPINSQSNEWQEVTIPLERFNTRKIYLHQVAVQPIANATGQWAIKSIIVAE